LPSLVRRARGHRDRVNSLTFAPDGRLLSGGLDTTVLAWSTRPPHSASALGAAWDELAQADAATAFKAQGRLLVNAAGALALFAEKIKPVEPVDVKRVRKLVADLDSPQFTTRDSAARVLRELGSQATVALQEATTKAESAEGRRRAQNLLDELAKSPITPAELRSLRAVEVLEWLDNPQARRLLDLWAKGAPGARLTVAADATNRRLGIHR
jgi:hypothetical protein